MPTISGEVIDNLQLFAGYTYNTTKYLDDPVNEGRTFSQWTPKHMLRVWSDYQFKGDWSRVNAGLGFTTQSHTLGYERTYEVPGYTVWNARLGYKLSEEVDLALNAYNLFDKHYYVAGYNQLDGNNRMMSKSLEIFLPQLPISEPNSGMWMPASSRRSIQPWTSDRNASTSVTTATDVYSLGVVLFKQLTKTFPKKIKDK